MKRAALITHDALPSLPGDAGRLTQLFQNLIGNALKFRRAGVTAQSHVSAVREGAWWHFTVRDDGIGIEQLYFGRIFVIPASTWPRKAGWNGHRAGRLPQDRGTPQETPPSRVPVGEGSVFHFTLSAGSATAMTE